MSNLETYEANNKSLREIGLTLAEKIQDEKLTVNIRNNLETLIQIHDKLHLFSQNEMEKESSVIYEESQIQSRSMSFSCNNSFDSFLDLQNPKMLSKNQKTQKPDLNLKAIDQDSNEMKKTKKILREKENEIDLLRKKELAYQSTMYSLSNELFEIKQTTKAKKPMTISPQKPFATDFFSSNHLSENGEVEQLVPKACYISEKSDIDMS